MHDNLSLFETDGYSMEPLLKRGDRIAVCRLPPESLRAGDLVLAEIEGRKVCHRVVGFLHEGGELRLLLRGDASFSRPDSVSGAACLGKVAVIIKPGRTVPLDTPGQRFLSKIAIYLFPPLMMMRRLAGRLLGR